MTTNFSGPVKSNTAFWSNPVTLADLPTASSTNEGYIYYVSDALKPSESEGSGTGNLVFSDGTSWITVSSSPSNLVTNGTFDTDSDWTKGAGWTISGGKANAAAGVSGVLEQSGVVPLTGSVVVSFDATRTSGSGFLYIAAGGSTLQENISADGSYEFTMAVQGTNTNIRFIANTQFGGTLDNVVVVLA